MHGVTSNEGVSAPYRRSYAPGRHKKQLPLCRWHHQHAAPAEVRAKYPWLVCSCRWCGWRQEKIHPAEQVRDGVLADAYEMANIMHQ
ncbi:recombination enhancement function domain protein [Escherichia coli]|nr:recombination enhancement function domain protein [Escherichia coli]